MTTFKFSYEGPFVVHRGKMLESDAYRSLGKIELKILARLEIELMRHCGTNNGRIICTYDDFAEYGIRRPSIPRALRRLRKVGLLVVTQRGRRSALRNPHHYRLPYLLSYDEAGNIIAPTDEWKSYRPIRSPKNGRSAQKFGNENVPGTGNENVPGTGNENVPMAPGKTRNQNVPTFYNLSISSPGEGCLEAEAETETVPFGIGHNAGPPLEDDDLAIPPQLRRGDADAACAGCRPAEIDWQAVAPASLNIPTFLLRGHPDCVPGDS